MSENYEVDRENTQQEIDGLKNDLAGSRVVLEKPKNWRCPSCGEPLEHKTAGKYDKVVCNACMRKFGTFDANEKEALWSFSTFANEVLVACNDDNWDKYESRVNKAYADMRPYFSKFYGNPFFAMLCVAKLTHGFNPDVYRDVLRGNTENREAMGLKIQSICKTCQKFAEKYEEDKSKTASNEQNSVDLLMGMYNQLQEEHELYIKECKKKRAIIVGSVIFGALLLLIAAFTCLYSYTPIKTHKESGVVFHIPHDAVSLFEKISIVPKVEEHLKGSSAYVDAKNALRNETEKFVLYDLSLSNGKRPLVFDGNITVELPIPEGYDTSALKLYHVISDEVYEEIPFAVSVANNSISFTTTHFSFYALAERHPIVTFDTNGAGEIERQIVNRDSLAIEPNTPEKIGYSFVGWFYEEHLWDFTDDTVKKDIKLKAKWSPNCYAVTLITNGGYVENRTVMVAYDGTYEGLPENVEKAGYTFLGWFTAATNGRKIEQDSVMHTAEDHTLYARFKVNTNTVIFNAHGGTGEMDSFELKPGESAKLPQNTFTKIGASFLGWSTTPTGEVVYTDQAKYTMGTNQSYTLYAQWEIDTNTVKFDKNGGEGVMADILMDYGTTQRLPENKFTKVGCSFIGWALTPDGEVVYTNKVEFTMGDKTEVVLYAKWQKNVNKLHFDPNGGKGGMPSMDIVYGEQVKLPECTFENEGYHFSHWAFSADKDAPIAYTQGGIFIMGAEHEYTLYAVWAGDADQISFHSNAEDAEGDMETEFKIATGTSAKLPVNKYTRKGYIFKGWATEQYGAKVYDDQAELFKEKKGIIHLYAVWEKITYEASFESNNGTKVDAIEFTVTDAAITLPVPERQHYEFLGWYDNADLKGDQITEIPKGSIQNRVYWAKWKAVEYTAVFKHLGKIVDTLIFTVETKTLTPPAISSHIGYTCVWENFELAAADITVNSICTANVYTATFQHNGQVISTQTFTVETKALDLPALPTHTGYACVWGDYEIVAADITVNSVCTANVYTATFQHNGQVIGTQTFTVETKTLDFPTLPTHTGYTCVWGDYEIIAADITVNSICTANVYTATFVHNGKVVAEKNFTVETQILTAPAISAHEGYVCNWETYELGTENITVRTVCTPIEYTATFIHDGTVLGTQKFTVETKALTLPQTPAHEGYQKCEWPNYQIAAHDITLIARCTPQEYTVTFVTNGGSSIAPITYTVLDGFSLPTTTQAGYTFELWYETENFEGTPIMAITKGTTGNKTLYAKRLAPIEYTATFEHNGQVIGTQTFTVETVSLALPAIPTHEGYACEWEPYAIQAQNIEVKTVCTPIKYQITFVTAGSPVDPITYTVEDAFVLAISSKNGYPDALWYDNEDFEGNPITEIKKGTTGNKTFYAKWLAPIEYTVTFETNGGKTIDPVVYTVEQTPLDLSAYVTIKTGNRFNGWYTDEACTGEPVTALPVGTYGNITLYCEWLPDEEYVACFDAYKVTDQYGTYGYTKGTKDNLLPGDVLQMTGVPSKYLYNTAAHKFFYVMVDGHWDTAQVLTENDIVYGGLSGVGTIGERTGVLTVDSSCINGKTFTVVVLDNKNGKPDYSSYAEARVFHFTVGERNADFASGLGTKIRPYLITEAAHLIHLADGSAYRQNAKLCFKLYNDIDMEMDANKNASFVGIPDFYGTFDGNGHRIFNFNISTGGVYAGFFGKIEAGAVVKNLIIGKDNGIADVYSVKIIANKYDTSGLHVGAVAGENRGEILNCTVEDVYLYGANDVDAGKSTALIVYVGGVTGINYGLIQSCTVTDSYMDGRSSTVKDTNPARTESKIGGVTGYSSGTIDDCCVYDCTMYAYAYSVDKNNAFTD
ncbi:MAG: InlB B-repeat-containing protein, partial [Clostridia bacterium]|nr:InlB B-repeat-containing protein [Clostridia bacterium]